MALTLGLSQRVLLGHVEGHAFSFLELADLCELLFVSHAIQKRTIRVLRSVTTLTLPMCPRLAKPPPTFDWRDEKPQSSQISFAARVAIALCKQVEHIVGPRDTWHWRERFFGETDESSEEDDFDEQKTVFGMSEGDLETWLLGMIHANKATLRSVRWRMTSSSGRAGEALVQCPRLEHFDAHDARFSGREDSRKLPRDAFEALLKLRNLRSLDLKADTAGSDNDSGAVSQNGLARALVAGTRMFTSSFLTVFLLGFPLTALALETRPESVGLITGRFPRLQQLTIQLQGETKVEHNAVLGQAINSLPKLATLYIEIRVRLAERIPIDWVVPELVALELHHEGIAIVDGNRLFDVDHNPVFPFRFISLHAPKLTKFAAKTPLDDQLLSLCFACPNLVELYLPHCYQPETRKMFAERIDEHLQRGSWPRLQKLVAHGASAQFCNLLAMHPRPLVELECYASTHTPAKNIKQLLRTHPQLRKIDWSCTFEEKDKDKPSLPKRVASAVTELFAAKPKTVTELPALTTAEFGVLTDKLLDGLVFPNLRKLKIYGTRVRASLGSLARAFPRLQTLEISSPVGIKDFPIDEKQPWPVRQLILQHPPALEAVPALLRAFRLLEDVQLHCAVKDEFLQQLAPIFEQVPMLRLQRLSISEDLIGHDVLNRARPTRAIIERIINALPALQKLLLQYWPTAEELTTLLEWLQSLHTKRAPVKLYRRDGFRRPCELTLADPASLKFGADMRGMSDHQREMKRLFDDLSSMSCCLHAYDTGHHHHHRVDEQAGDTHRLLFFLPIFPHSPLFTHMSQVRVNEMSAFVVDCCSNGVECEKECT